MGSMADIFHRLYWRGSLVKLDIPVAGILGIVASPIIILLNYPLSVVVFFSLVGRRTICVWGLVSED